MPRKIRPTSEELAQLEQKIPGIFAPAEGRDGNKPVISTVRVETIDEVAAKLGGSLAFHEKRGVNGRNAIMVVYRDDLPADAPVNATATRTANEGGRAIRKVIRGDAFMFKVGNFVRLGGGM